MSEQLPIILTSAIVSFIASIITFFITTVWYQARKERRLDKIHIFKQLMATRGILDYESVKAINTIHVVFNKNEDVTEACAEYINSLKFDGEFTEALEKHIEEKEQKLLKAIAKDKDLKFPNIDLNIIKNTKHNPRFLNYGVRRDEKMDKQLDELKGMLVPIAEKFFGIK